MGLSNIILTKVGVIATLYGFEYIKIKCGMLKELPKAKFFQLAIKKVKTGPILAKIAGICI